MPPCCMTPARAGGGLVKNLCHVGRGSATSPRVVNCTDLVGRITPQAAAELGLACGDSGLWRRWRRRADWGGGRRGQRREHPYLSGYFRLGLHGRPPSGAGYEEHDCRDHRGPSRPISTTLPNWKRPGSVWSGSGTIWLWMKSIFTSGTRMADRWRRSI